MKIVIGPDIKPVGLDELRREFPAVEFVSANTPAEQVEASRGADAYLGRMSRDAFLAAGPNLRWIHSGGAGIENVVSTVEIVESDVEVTNTRGGHAPCIADHTMGLLLALTRKLPTLLGEQAKKSWQRQTESSGARSLTGMTLVIVGMGNIGREIAKRAVAFDMRVIGVDVYPGEVPAGVEAVWGLDGLDEALSMADAVAVATPLTPETRNLIDARRIGLLKPGSYLLVVSRGGIINEPALIESLEKGRLAGAGLDVQEREPMPADDPLWDAPNVIITPHSSGVSSLTTGRVWSITEENVRRFIAGKPLANVCDKRAGF